MTQDHIAGDVTERRESEVYADGASRLILASVGNVGLAILPGQSPEQVLAAAEVIERELDVGVYTARDVARRVIEALTTVAQEDCRTHAP